MAYIFELAAECAEDKEAAENIANFFKDSTITLSNGTKIKLAISVTQSEHSWWCTVEPEGVSRTGATPRITTIALRAEILNALYNRLRLCRRGGSLPPAC